MTAPADIQKDFAEAADLLPDLIQLDEHTFHTHSGSERGVYYTTVIQGDVVSCACIKGRYNAASAKRGHNIPPQQLCSHVKRVAAYLRQLEEAREVEQGPEAAEPAPARVEDLMAALEASLAAVKNRMGELGGDDTADADELDDIAPRVPSLYSGEDAIDAQDAAEERFAAVESELGYDR